MGDRRFITAAGRPPPSPRVRWGIGAHAFAMNCKAGQPVSDDLGPLFVQARRFLPSDPAPFEATTLLARDSVHAPVAAGDEMIRFLETWLEPDEGRSLFDWQERRDCGL